MGKLRLREPDYTLLVDALECYASAERNYLCIDYIETHGIAAAREHERIVRHCETLIERIRKARQP